MSDFIDQFVKILTDNQYVVKYNDVTDEINKNDKTASAIKETLGDDVNMPDAMHYYELNGKSSPKELKKYLEKYFQKYKKEYLAVEPDSKDNAYSNMLASLNGILANFTPAYREVMESNNSSLIELFNVKVSILKRIDEFISSNPTSAEYSSKDRVYYFKVREGFEYKYDIHLNSLYYGLKDNRFINCTPVQFKALFRPIGKTKTKTPEPIIWLSGAYSHLAYFIKCLVKAKFIKKTNQPSANQIARELFYDNEVGKYFSTTGIKSDIKNTSISPYAEITSLIREKLK